MERLHAQVGGTNVMWLILLKIPRVVHQEVSHQEMMLQEVVLQEVVLQEVIHQRIPEYRAIA
jgi:hypothetical protein